MAGNRCGRAHRSRTSRSRARNGGPCAAQALRLDRTKSRLCSAAELVPFEASLERNFEQSSPSAPVATEKQQVADRICSASASARSSAQFATQRPPSLWMRDSPPRSDEICPEPDRRARSEPWPPAAWKDEGAGRSCAVACDCGVQPDGGRANFRTCWQLVSAGDRLGKEVMDRRYKSRLV